MQTTHSKVVQYNIAAGALQYDVPTRVMPKMIQVHNVKNHEKNNIKRIKEFIGLVSAWLDRPYSLPVYA